METDRPAREADSRLEEQPEFVAWAKNRMKEMKEAAADATEALGLPPERTFDVLRVMFGGPQSDSAGERGANPQTQPQAMPKAE